MGKVPVWEKVILTMDEAVEYSGIGKNKLYELARMPFCPFLLMNGSRRLIKRKELEKYLLAQRSI